MSRSINRGIAVRALVAACTTFGLLITGAQASAHTVSVSPTWVDAGDSVSVRVSGARGRTCALTVRRDRSGSSVTLRRKIRRSLRIPVGSKAAGGRRVVRVRCGGRAASVRFRVTARPTTSRPSPSRTTPTRTTPTRDTPAVLSDSESELGRLPIDPDEVESYSIGDNVGGAGFSTRVPFARGARIRVSQSPGGGYSHSGAYTRNAIDLVAPAGTPVLAGFSGVVAAARGGCAPSGSWGCNSGWGNFVLLRNADGTCAIHGHLTTITTTVGQQLARYGQIGTIGSSGSSTGPHLHYDRMDCRSQLSQPWSFEEAGIPPAGATITSGNEPEASAPAPAPAPTPAPAPAPAPPTRIVLTVDNRVTNGAGMREDSTPARLTTQPWTYCGSRGCNINGTERGSGGQYDAAVCTTFGERTTNGNDSSAADDANPARYESTRYYGVRLGNGTFGLVSEVWIHPSQRGGLGLPGC